jgi:preprotein translocase subunit SecG
MWILILCTLLLWQVRDGLNLSSCQITGGGDLQRFVLAQGALNCVQLLIFLFFFFCFLFSCFLPQRIGRILHVELEI